MIVVTNGQLAPVGGWFRDQHGHSLYLRRGQIVTLCPQFGPFTPAWWRLARIVDG